MSVSVNENVFGSGVAAREDVNRSAVLPFKMPPCVIVPVVVVALVRVAL
jgi:hypothetical protein